MEIVAAMSEQQEALEASVLRGVHNRELTCHAGSYDLLHKVTRLSLVLPFWATSWLKESFAKSAVMKSRCYELSHCGVDARLSYPRLTLVSGSDNSADQ